MSERPKKATPRKPVGQTLPPPWNNRPGEFEAKDFKEIAGSIGLTIPTAERYIRAWIGARLEKVAGGRYRKTL